MIGCCVVVPTWVTGQLGSHKIVYQVMGRKLDKLQSNVIFCIFLAHDRPLIVVGPGATAQVRSCIKAALMLSTNLLTVNLLNFKNMYLWVSK